MSRAGTLIQINPIGGDRRGTHKADAGAAAVAFLRREASRNSSAFNITNLPIFGAGMPPRLIWPRLI
jgi:hypothetical protein